MSNFPSLLRITLSALAVAALLPAQDANAAVTSTRSSVSLCQGALPSHEGAFRKRPVAIANEGTTSAFLSCGLESEVTSPGGGTGTGARAPHKNLKIGFANNTNVAQVVTCTTVDNRPAVARFATRSVALLPNAPGILDFGTLEWAYLQFSCNIPAGVEIGSVTDTY